MKLKTIALASAASLAVLALASCGQKNETTNPTGTGSSATTTSTDPIEDYVSLANKHANGAIDAEGYYTVGDVRIKTKDTYKMAYQTEMSDFKFNYFLNTWQYNSLQYGNMVDGLIGNDQYGNTVGDLATGYKVENLEDGKQKWTFKLRQGVKWLKNDGTEYAEVKADDFVAGIEYVLDPINASELEYLVDGLIDGSHEYYESRQDNEITDSGITGTENDVPFDQVGIRAIDDYTLEYTLTEKTPYFLTCLTYGCYYPVNRDFLDEMGTEFGADENSILINGAFRMTAHRNESYIELTKNDKYYDAAHVYVNKIEETYIERKAGIEQARLLYENGDIDGFTVQSTDTKGWEKYVTGPDNTGTAKNPYDPNCSSVTSTDQFCFNGYFNYIRSAYEYSDTKFNKTDAEKTNTSKAVTNNNFRLGFLYGLNVMEYLKYYYQEDPSQRLIRSYTVKDLAVDENGRDYVEYVEDVYNEKQGTTGVRLNGTDQGNDPVYNPERAKEYFQKAKAELEEQGVTFPIKIDVIGAMEAKQQAYQAKMYSAIEENSDGLVDIQMNIPSSDSQDVSWMSRTHNFDFNINMGWGADYGDPKSFLHTLIEGTGDTISYMGFSGNLTDEQKALMHELLGEYTEMYEEGIQYTEVSQLSKRFKEFAEAEYYAIYEKAIIIPYYTRSGLYPTVSRVIPHQSGKAGYGLNSDKYKNVIVSENPITQEQRTAINNAYEANK